MIRRHESKALQALSEWLDEKYDHKFMVRLVIHPESPWLVIDAAISGPVESSVPESLGFAIWRRTGAVFASEYGEVADDPIIEGTVTPR